MMFKQIIYLTSLLIFLAPVAAQDGSEMGLSIKIIESAVEPGVSRLNSVSSNDNVYQAFTVCLPKPGVDGCSSALFIEETKTGRIYQIQGMPLEWRPVSNLMWIDDNLLIFEQWSNPNFGYRYTVDMKLKKLMTATPISD